MCYEPCTCRCISRKPGIFGMVETAYYLGKWSVVLHLLFCGAVCMYCGWFFSDVVCDFAASKYLILIGGIVWGVSLVEVFDMCIVNHHSAHDTLDSMKPKKSKIVNIGRLVFRGGLVIILLFVSLIMYNSKTCERTSEESSAAKLTSRNFATLYVSLTTIVTWLCLICLINGLFNLYKKLKQGAVGEVSEEDERQSLMETNRAAMEAHHAET